jgi:hypothetical protein
MEHRGWQGWIRNSQVRVQLGWQGWIRNSQVRVQLGWQGWIRNSQVRVQLGGSEFPDTYKYGCQALKQFPRQRSLASCNIIVGTVEDSKQRTTCEDLLYIYTRVRQTIY